MDVFYVSTTLDTSHVLDWCVWHFHMLSIVLVAFVLATRIFITYICHVFASGSQIISHGICLVIYSHFPTFQLCPRPDCNSCRSQRIPVCRWQLVPILFCPLRGVRGVSTKDHSARGGLISKVQYIEREYMWIIVDYMSTSIASSFLLSTKDWFT